MEVGTFHTPMLKGHEHWAWYTTSTKRKRDGMNFGHAFKVGMTVRLYRKKRI
jgi:hypothetical protein